MSEYFQNFWNPVVGHTVEYHSKKFVISDLAYGTQVSFLGCNKIAWIQDLTWIPCVKDVDDIVQSQLGAQIHNNTIKVVSKTTKKVCYFSRPDSVPEYESTVKEIRAYLAIN